MANYPQQLVAGGLDGGASQPTQPSPIAPPGIVRPPDIGMAETARYWLGVNAVSTRLWLPAAGGQWAIGEGIWVTRVVPYSSAWGRLDPGDIILAVNGMRVGDPSGLPDLLRDAGRTGGAVTLTIRNVRNGQIENHVIPLQYY